MTGLITIASVLALPGFVLALIYYSRRRAVDRARQGFDLARARDVVADSGWGAMRVTGVVSDLVLELVVQEGGKNTPNYVVVTASLPTSARALEVYLSQQHVRDRGLVARGLEIDLDTGDADFDAAVVVEAAPADVALALLDGPTRALVLAAMPCDVAITSSSVRCKKPGNVSAPPFVADMLGLVAHLASRVAEAQNAVEERRLDEARVAGEGAYRGPPGGVAARAGDATELDRLREVRTRRTQRERRIGIGLMALMMLGSVGYAMVMIPKRASRPSPVPASAHVPTASVPRAKDTAAKPTPPRSIPLTTAPPAKKAAPASAQPTHATTFLDTEGRSFSESKRGPQAAYADPVDPAVTSLAEPNATYGTPGFGLWFDSHYVRFCDGYRDATGLRAVYEGCRPVVCATTTDCPAVPGGSATFECLNGWCGTAAIPFDANDAVAACLAGTGPDWRSPPQRELTQKARRACPTKPCTLPSECTLP